MTPNSPRTKAAVAATARFWKDMTDRGSGTLVPQALNDVSDGFERTLRKDCDSAVFRKLSIEAVSGDLQVGCNCPGGPRMLCYQYGGESGLILLGLGDSTHYATEDGLPAAASKAVLFLVDRRDEGGGL